MTENEAIDKLNNLHYKIIHTSFCNKVYESEIEALCMAKDCLKEIQQYRAIGTVEELQKLKALFGNENVKVSELITKILKEYPEYLSIGTVEEFKTLKEKSVVKKPIVKGVMGFDGEEAYYCPSCKEKLYEGHFEIGLCNCGQSISYWAKE